MVKRVNFSKLLFKEIRNFYLKFTMSAKKKKEKKKFNYPKNNQSTEDNSLKEKKKRKEKLKKIGKIIQKKIISFMKLL